MSRKIKLLPEKPGIYLLIIHVERDLKIKTRGRKFNISPGFYIYVGSARGIRGLYSRIKRHLSRDKKLFWHIDYLLINKHVMVKEIFYKVVEKQDTDYESIIALHLAKKLRPVPGFGCSDKPWDISHLFKCGDYIKECLSKINDMLNRDFKYISIE